MLEITLDENLIECERGSWPKLHPLIDLSQNIDIAKRVALIAERFFRLSLGVVFSGYARPVDETDGNPGSKGPVFYIQVWHGEKLCRTVGFRDTGYVGILHVDLPEEQEFGDSVDMDLIGDLCKGIEKNRPLPDGYAESCIGYVTDGRLEFVLPNLSD